MDISTLNWDPRPSFSLCVYRTTKSSEKGVDVCDLLILPWRGRRVSPAEVSKAFLVARFLPCSYYMWCMDQIHVCIRGPRIGSRWGNPPFSLFFGGCWKYMQDSRWDVYWILDSVASVDHLFYA